VFDEERQSLALDLSCELDFWRHVYLERAKKDYLCQSTSGQTVFDCEVLELIYAFSCHSV
jgi:hypothetical protein